MAHRLNLRVDAEVVEPEAQAGALRDSGCDQAQGFLYGRPLDAPDAGRYLAVRPQPGRSARRPAA